MGALPLDALDYVQWVDGSCINSAVGSKCVFAWLTSLGHLHAQFYNGSAWQVGTNVTLAPNIGATNSTSKSFDVTFDTPNGYFLVVFANASSHLYYSIFNISTGGWNSPLASRVSTSPCIGYPQWIELLPWQNSATKGWGVFRDSNSDYCSLVYSNYIGWGFDIYSYSLIANTSNANNQTTRKKFALCRIPFSIAARDVLYYELNSGEIQARWTYSTYSELTDNITLANTGADLMWGECEGGQLGLEAEGNPFPFVSMFGGLFQNTSAKSSLGGGMNYWIGGTFYSGNLLYVEGIVNSTSPPAFDITFTPNSTGCGLWDNCGGRFTVAYADLYPEILYCGNFTACNSSSWSTVAYSTSAKCGLTLNRVGTLSLTSYLNHSMLFYSTNATTEPICTQYFNGTNSTSFAWSEPINLENTNSYLTSARPYWFEWISNSLPPWYNTTGNYSFCSGTADCTSYNITSCIARVPICQWTTSCVTNAGCNVVTTEAVCSSVSGCSWTNYTGIGWNATANETNPLPTNHSIKTQSLWYDDVGVESHHLSIIAPFSCLTNGTGTYLENQFENWGSGYYYYTPCHNDTIAHVTYCGYDLEPTIFNVSWANLTLNLSDSCEGKNFTMITAAFDIESNSNSTSYSITVQNVSPSTTAFAMNDTNGTPASTSVCTNATVTDIGVGVSKVWMGMIFPNSTAGNCYGTELPCSTWNADPTTCNTQFGCYWDTEYTLCMGFHLACTSGGYANPTVCSGNLTCSWNYTHNVNVTLDNASVKGTCGGSGSTYSAMFGVGSTASPPNLTIEYIFANDTVGNLLRYYLSNVSTAVYTDNAPWFPAVGMNNTNATGLEYVMFNATLADDFGLSVFNFSWTTMAVGSPCDTALTDNLSVVFTGANNTNASIVRQIPEVCEGNLILWSFAANDSINQWNSTAIQSFTPWADAKPQLPAIGANNTTPSPNVSVMFNATLYDDYGLSGYIFGWRGGVPCGTLTNDSWVAWSTSTGANQCGGTAASCDTWDTTSEATCTAQSGCLWFELEWDCYGTHNPCITYTTSASCNGNLTCSWGNNTNATKTKTIPNDCEGTAVSYYFYANDSSNQWNSSSSTVVVQNVNPVIQSMKVNVTSAYLNTQVCVNATVTDVGIGVNSSTVTALFYFPNETTAVVYLTNSSSKGTCGGGGDVYSVFVGVGSTSSPPNLTIGLWSASDLNGNSGSNTSQLNVSVGAHPNVSLAPQYNKAFTNAINPNVSSTVILASNWSDKFAYNTYPSSYGAGMLGNWTVSTNATNSLYYNYLMQSYTEYIYTGAYVYKNVTLGQTFKIPNNWAAFGMPVNGTTLPEIVQLCVRLYRYNNTGTVGNVTAEIHAAAANGSPNMGNTLAFVNLTSISNSTAILWHCGVLNQSLYLTANTNYTMVFKAYDTMPTNAFRFGISHYNAYPWGRYWGSTNRSVSWTLGGSLYDINFRFLSKPIATPTWVTMNASAWRSDPRILKNTTNNDFREPSITEDFTNSFQVNGTTPIGWNASGNPAYFGVQPSTLCTNNAGGSIGLPCLYFNDTLATIVPQVSYYFGGGVRYARISFTMVNKNSTGAQWMYLYSNNTAAVLILQVGMNGSLFRYTNNTNATFFKTLANTSNFLGEFLNVTLDVNTLTAKFNLSVNGDSVQNEGLAQTSQTYLAFGVNRILLYNWHASRIGQSWIANISVKDFLFGNSAWANFTLATPTDAGYYRWNVTAYDTDGNTNSSNNNLLCVNISGGCGIWSQIVSPKDGAFLNGNVTLVAQITSPNPILNVSYQRINASSPTGSWTSICVKTSEPFNTCLWEVDGMVNGSTWKVQAVVYDTTGITNNKTAYALNVTYGIDKLKPAVWNHVVTYPAGQNYAFLGQNVTLNLSATDYSGSGMKNVTVNALEISELCGSNANMTLYGGGSGSNQTGNWTVNCTISIMPEGLTEYQLPVSAIDLAVPTANVNNDTLFFVNVSQPISTGCSYMGFGDWTIPAGTNCVFSDTTFNVSGDFNVSGNASFTNSVFKVNSSFDGQYGIEVYGNLTSYNSTWERNQTSAYSFIAEANSYFSFQNSTVSGAGWEDANGKRGLTIRASNAILNSSIFSNDFIGLSVEDATPIQLANNTASSNNLYGFYLRGMSGATVHNLTTSNNGGAGVFDENGVSNIYSIINSTNNGETFVLSQTSGVLINYLNANDSCGANVGLSDGACVQTSSSDVSNSINNSVIFSKISNEPLLLVLSGGALSVYNTTINSIADTFTGAIVYNGQLSVFNSTIYVKGLPAIYDYGYGAIIVDGDANFTVINSTLITKSVNAPAISFLTSGQNTLPENYVLNTTFNNSDFTGVSGIVNLTVQWYVRVNVTNTTGSAFSGAVVNATDSSGLLVFNGTTAANGLTDFFVVTESINSSVANVSFNPHNVSASATGYHTNSTNFSLTATQTVRLWLNVSNTPPQFVSHNVSPLSPTVWISNLSILFNATWTDDFGVNSTYLVWNAPDNYLMTLVWGDATNGTWQYNLTGQTAGTYFYYFSANDSSDAWNYSPEYNYTISKANPDFHLFLNGLEGDASILQGTIANATAVSGNDCTLYLLKDGLNVSNPFVLLLSPDVYNFTASCVEQANYSGGNATYFLLVKTDLGQMGGGAGGGGVSPFQTVQAITGLIAAQIKPLGWAWLLPVVLFLGYFGWRLTTARRK